MTRQPRMGTRPTMWPAFPKSPSRAHFGEANLCNRKFVNGLRQRQAASATGLTPPRAAFGRGSRVPSVSWLDRPGRARRVMWRFAGKGCRGGLPPSPIPDRTGHQWPADICGMNIGWARFEHCQGEERPRSGSSLSRWSGMRARLVSGSRAAAGYDIDLAPFSPLSNGSFWSIDFSGMNDLRRALS